MSKRRVQQTSQNVKPSRLSHIFFGLAVLVVVTMVYLSADVRWNAIRGATEMRLSDTPPRSLVIPEGTVERHFILPVSGIDGKWWVLHAEKMVSEGRFRLRHTDLDGAPVGREVHWSSGLSWLIIVLGFVIDFFSPLPFADTLAFGAALSGPLLLLAGSVAFGLVIRIQSGWLAAGAAVVFFGTYAPVSDLFRFGDCDHHGLVGWLAMMGVLCLILGQVGLADSTSPKRNSKAPDFQRRWFFWGGIAMGAAMWVSAATAIPIIAAIMLGTLAATWLRGEVDVRPELWRVWGISGGLTSLAFYLLEYFPANMGFRLEVNHPLYAAAWIGGAEILSRAVRKLGGGQFITGDRGWEIGILSLSTLALAVPALLIVTVPGLVFWVADPFLLALHNRHIAEFQNLMAATAGGAQPVILTIWFALPLVSILTVTALALRGQLSALERSGFVLSIIVALFLFGMGALQVRWFLISAFFWVLFSALVAAACLRRCHPKGWQWGIWVAAMAVFGLLPSTIIIWRTWERTTADRTAIPKDMATNLIARDLVHRLLHISNKRPTLLSGPTTSTDLAYYGGVAVLGTLYWENKAGLKDTAKIFSSLSPQEFRAGLDKHGVDYLVLFSWDEFTQNYLALLEGRHVGEKVFITGLLEGNDPPRWLRPLFYPIPKSLGLEGERVTLFQFVPEQTESEALVWQAQFVLDSGDAARARVLALEAQRMGSTDPRLAALIGPNP